MEIISNYNRLILDDNLYLTDDENIAYQRDMSTSVEYKDEYFQKYINYEGSEISKKLNKFRTEITSKYVSTLLDIGIGSGEFIKSSKITVFGYDINPVGIDWLNKRNIFLDPYTSNLEHIQGISFWDTLEHIPEPSKLLNKILPKQYVFISIPIFENLKEIKKSKHYRLNEHYFYFTTEGLKRFLGDHNLHCLEIRNDETLAGRENIISFVFQRL